MAMPWIRIGTWLLVVVNVGFGVFAVAAPGRVAGMVGWTIDAPHGAGELRAVYGGLVGALGVMLGLAWSRRDGSWYSALAIGFAGLTLGRLVSLAVDTVATYTLVAAVFEGLTALFLWRAGARLGEAQRFDDPISNDSPR